MDAIQIYPVKRFSLLERFARRALDLIVGIPMLCLTAPVWLLAALAVRIETKGNPFFLQTRIGLGGIPFRIVKLRGMYIDARTRFPELYDYTRFGGLDFHFHYKEDPRLTRVGSIIRKTSIDELPNFINVVRGEMTLVGPRPEVPDVLKLYGDYLAPYVSVKPGITCLSKVTGRDTLTKRETIELDLAYVRDVSLRTQATVLWKTFKIVLLRQDVYAETATRGAAQKEPYSQSLNDGRDKKSIQIREWTKHPRPLLQVKRAEDSIRGKTSRSKGRFVTFEGLDGTGKSTQIQLLASVLKSRGIEVIVTREPGSTPLGEELRTIMLDSQRKDIAPYAELALLFACRAQLLHDVIEPALERGRWVLCDRFTDSSEAYQGCGRGLGSEVIHTLHKVLANNREPWMTVMLDGDLETSLGRARSRNSLGEGSNEGRFEAESSAFHQKVQTGFRTIAARDTHRVVLIDARRSIDTIHDEILSALDSRLWSEEESFDSSTRRLSSISPK